VLPDIVKGEGCYLYDLQGNKYLDLESGIWCLALGHCHPQINDAIRTQAGILTHSGYCYANPVMEHAANAVLDILNIPDGKCVFLSSGSEAVEFGVQALRKITAKPLILTLSDSFLGSYGSAGSKRQDEWVARPAILLKTATRNVAILNKFRLNASRHLYLSPAARRVL
jgi:acetylornithine aminotransferase